ncbi:MAG: hypothetical protein K8U03_20500, partial [Planctomycetia bacterium]|nr:hypothetical protein [Planctomycetia bacterium]
RTKYIAAGALAGLLLLAGIIVKVRDKDGNVVAEVNVPNGATVEVVPQTNPRLIAATPLPQKAAPPTSPSFITPSFVPSSVSPGEQNLPAGKWGLRFEPGQYVEAGPAPHRETTVVTTELWLTNESDQTNAPVLFVGGPNGNINYADSKFYMYTFHGGNPAGIPAVTNRRIHLAAVNDGKGRRFYLNGKLATQSDFAGNPNPGDRNKSLPIRISDPVRFRGVIDSMRISSSARYDQDFTPAEKFTPDKATFALYHFDEGQGNVLKDSSGNGYHGKIIGATWVRGGSSPNPTKTATATTASASATPPPPGDYALNCQGDGPQFVSPHVVAPTLMVDARGPLTLEARVWPYGHNEGRVLGTADLRLRFRSAQWNISAPGLELTRPTPIEYRRWYHLAAVRAENELRLFVDGKLVARQPYSTADGPQGPMTREALEIGGGSSQMRIDEIRISKSARYVQDFTPQPRFTPDADTLALFHCDEGAGTVLKDASPAGYEAKLAAATWIRNDGAPTTTTTSMNIASQPAAVRWPLANTKPQEIAWLKSLNARVILRNGTSGDRIVPFNEATIPPGLWTVVGVELHRDSGSKIDDKALGRIAGLVDLETFLCNFPREGTTVTKAGLEQLKSLVNLRHLQVGRLAPPDADPAILDSFPQLESLELVNEPFQGWEPRVARMANLSALSLYTVDGAKLDQLGVRPRLISLRFAGYQDHHPQRLTAAKPFIAANPWCRVTFVGLDGDHTKQWVIEPTAPPEKTSAADPAFEQWLKDTAAKPAEEQIAAVSKKMMELNPGFDGLMNGPRQNSVPTTENGEVVSLRLNGPSITNISPLRAFTGLKQLSFGGSGSPVGKLTDLSPLAEMQVTDLTLPGMAFELTDLSTLKGLRLEKLICRGLRNLVDVSAIEGMPLKQLDLLGTGMVDTTPLKNLRLDLLILPNGRTDLTPFQGMPLTRIECGDVADLSPLRGMPLKVFWCDAARITDYSPLYACKDLTELRFVNAKITPVAALQKALPNCKIEWIKR